MGLSFPQLPFSPTRGLPLASLIPQPPASCYRCCWEDWSPFSYPVTLLGQKFYPRHSRPRILALKHPPQFAYKVGIIREPSFHIRRGKLRRSGVTILSQGPAYRAGCRSWKSRPLFIPSPPPPLHLHKDTAREIVRSKKTESCTEFPKGTDLFGKKEWWNSCLGVLLKTVKMLVIPS